MGGQGVDSIIFTILFHTALTFDISAENGGEFTCKTFSNHRDYPLQLLWFYTV
jgi:hypothetical protein